MNHSIDSYSASRSLEREDGDSLVERLQPRVAVEHHFAKLGHTYRHGRAYRKFEHGVTRPVLKLGLQLAGLYSRGTRNALTPRVTNLRLEFPNLPSAFDGFRILHLSDLHIDGIPDLVAPLSRELRRLEPDVCLLTGDYRFEDYGPCEPVYPLMREILASLRPRRGTYGILGNHDTAEIAVALEKMGVRMLVNEAVAIDEGSDVLWLLGVDDPFDYRTHDLARARAGIPAHSFEVLLAHAPEIYEEAAQAGVSLYLSGHTHGGQIRVPGIGAIRRNANCPQAYAAGHWKHKGMQGYTSSGIGCSSLPVRLNCPPEIVMLELRRAPFPPSGRI